MRKSLGVVVVLAAVALSLPSSGRGGELTGGKTHATLIADVKSILPGKDFTLGIHLTMEPGWHTYWKNPGESGLATTVSWTVPEGYSVGDIQWPVPEKMVESGDVLTYAYTGETLLMVPVQTASSVQVGSVARFKARVDWLECEAICVPGSAEVELSLPVSDNPPVTDHPKLFQKFRAELPKPLHRDSTLSLRSSFANGILQLKIFPGRAKAGIQGKVDFFPEPLEGYTVGRPALQAGADSVLITVPLTPVGEVSSGSTFRGVILRSQEGRRVGATLIQVPIPQKPSKSLLEEDFQIGPTGGGQEPFLLYLLFALLGGLLLNIMPCVLPVIALKVFSLVRMAGDQSGRVRKMGWFFSLGILASFLLLALLVIGLKIAGGEVGWGFQFQEPRFVIAMSAIVFAFGLSLFGVYEIRVPGAAVSSLNTVLGGQIAEGKGYGASFWEGVFATILATPCTAPFLGSALGFAFSQPWWIILAIFTAVAAGMALPYLILTARPAWMRFLPKPGAWMESAKQFMGFLMMATLLWLLYVLGRQLGMEAVIWTGAFLLSVGIACWMIGRFVTLTVSRRRAIAVWIGALAVVLAGYFVFLNGVLDLQALIAGTSDQGAAGDTEGRSGIVWERFSLHNLESRLSGNRPVFLDFTADWCLTCKVNEHAVLSDQAVIDALRSSNFVPMRADWTTRNPEITELLQKFGRPGVPLYVIFPAGKPTHPIILPEVITPKIVLDGLRKAVAAP